MRARFLGIGDGRQKSLQNTTASHIGGSVSANYLRGIRDYLIQHHEDVDAFFGVFDLDIDVLEDASQRIPRKTHQLMLLRAGELTQNPDVGLHTGECIKPGQYGVLGLSVMSCKNAQECFERHMRYEKLVADRAVSTYHYEGDQIRLSWDTHGLALGRETADENIASWVTFMRWITGQRLNVTAVHFTHAQPDDLSQYQRIFECPVLFGQSMVELIFPASYSRLPIVQHDPVMRKMMDAHAEKLLAEFDHRDEFTSRVRTIIVKGLAIGEATLDEVARHLAITPRTLQRRMNERAETFKSVLDEVRRGLALTYIAQPSIDLAELAYLLGFSDQTAFQRAFKKWTGTSPGKYKKSLT